MFNMCKVVNKRFTQKFDVDITRPSKWGNPYSHLNFSLAEYKVDTPEDAVKFFEEYLINNDELMNSLHELKYKVLGCVCSKNAPCHGKILKKYVDRLEYLDELNNHFQD